MHEKTQYDNSTTLQRTVAQRTASQRTAAQRTQAAKGNAAQRNEHLGSRQSTLTSWPLSIIVMPREACSTTQNMDIGQLIDTICVWSQATLWYRWESPTEKVAGVDHRCQSLWHGSTFSFILQMGSHLSSIAVFTAAFFIKQIWVNIIRFTKKCERFMLSQTAWIIPWTSVFSALMLMKRQSSFLNHRLSWQIDHNEFCANCCHHCATKMRYIVLCRGLLSSVSKMQQEHKCLSSIFL